MSDRSVALIGNPNTGKSTLFNALTGLRQKTGNYPGVTVERKAGRYVYKDQSFMVIDLPGAYSLNPRSMDEHITYETLVGRFEYEQKPDVIVVVIDASNLERNLFLVSQASALDLPVVVALNMVDVARQKGITIDIPALSKAMRMPVVEIHAQKGLGIESLKEILANPKLPVPDMVWDPPEDLDVAIALLAGGWLSTNTTLTKGARKLEALRLLQNPEGAARYVHEKDAHQLRDQVKEAITVIESGGHSASTYEILSRYKWIGEKAASCIRRMVPEDSFTARIDKVATHKIFGPLIFVAILLLIFQSIFSWSEPFMNGIENMFNQAGLFASEMLPEGLFSSLLTDGILAGLGGVVVFLPQILFLFFFISVLEGSGYMARAAFVMDGFMAKIGLHGRSVVPLISGFACAIPGIMATRTIENWRDRLITIMVLPFMACSARLPVYALLVAAFIPERWFFGFIPAQGLVFFGLYFFGILVAIISALVLKLIYPQKESVPFIMELPTYKWPNFRDIGIDMLERGWVFVREAGQTIMVISLILWFAARFPTMPEAELNRVIAQVPDSIASQTLASEQLRYSLAGRFGRVIEPVIEPLGFDWKIGIAIVTSFAAREVMVGTLNTLYSVQAEDDEIQTLKEKLRNDINPRTGKPVFSLLSSISLMLFFALSMQCMSTLAIVRRETNTWKWPIVMFVYMTVLAYVICLGVFQLGTLAGIK